MGEEKIPCYFTRVVPTTIEIADSPNENQSSSQSSSPRSRSRSTSTSTSTSLTPRLSPLKIVQQQYQKDQKCHDYSWQQQQQQLNSFTQFDTNYRMREHKLKFKQAPLAFNMKKIRPTYFQRC
eukprot:TRINITY_DN6673_c0_g1_i1.p1 TRINITY_DN6673_c0_g1~~TRINITY_DN6673_c0_g1_i1.p1  ORF type:complete len:123 (+),score=12.12 TRINITY_DN6673_c0_g1_i1:50-418(+)